jgi:hypothetical protein
MLLRQTEQQFFKLIFNKTIQLSSCLFVILSRLKSLFGIPSRWFFYHYFYNLLEPPATFFLSHFRSELIHFPVKGKSAFFAHMPFQTGPSFPIVLFGTPLPSSSSGSNQTKVEM